MRSAPHGELVSFPCKGLESEAEDYATRSQKVAPGDGMEARHAHAAYALQICTAL